MRIWDIHPGYLNRQSLLGEHRELHGIASILLNGKKGYSRHPETIRWIDHGWALTKRHQLLAAEMALRGFVDKSPVQMRSNEGAWPKTYIDDPFRQFQILAMKYENREQGRIPLPKNAQQLWSHHKYSVLARDQDIYREIGRNVSGMRSRNDFSDLAMTIAEVLKQTPTSGDIRNALQHMWGHVSGDTPANKREIDSWTSAQILIEVQRGVVINRNTYLLSSTALSELKAWI